MDTDVRPEHDIVPRLEEGKHRQTISFSLEQVVLWSHLISWKYCSLVQSVRTSLKRGILFLVIFSDSYTPQVAFDL